MRNTGTVLCCTKKEMFYGRHFSLNTNSNFNQFDTSSRFVVAPLSFTTKGMIGIGMVISLLNYRYLIDNPVGIMIFLLCRRAGFIIQLRGSPYSKIRLTKIFFRGTVYLAV